MIASFIGTADYHKAQGNAIPGKSSVTFFTFSFFNK